MEEDEGRKKGKKKRRKLVFVFHFGSSSFGSDKNLINFFVLVVALKLVGENYVNYV